MWEGRPLAMRESVIQRQSFGVVVQVDLQVPQADGLSWECKGKPVSQGKMSSVNERKIMGGQ